MPRASFTTGALMKSGVAQKIPIQMLDKNRRVQEEIDPVGSIDVTIGRVTVRADLLCWNPRELTHAPAGRT
jgi:hypothetical protein